MSKKATVTCGVLQGSGFGPLLFLLYVNAINQCSNKFRFYLFADDTNILYADQKFEDTWRESKRWITKALRPANCQTIKSKHTKIELYFIPATPTRRERRIPLDYIYLIARKVAMQDLNQKIILPILAFYLINNCWPDCQTLPLHTTMYTFKYLSVFNLSFLNLQTCILGPDSEDASY